MPQLVKLSSSKKHHFVAILHEKDTVESMLMRDFCFSVLIHQQLWAIITIVGKLTQNEFTTNSLVIIWNWHCAKPCREWEENLFKCWKFARKWQIVHVWAGHCRDFVKRKFEKNGFNYFYFILRLTLKFWLDKMLIFYMLVTRAKGWTELPWSKLVLFLLSLSLSLLFSLC